MQVPSKEIWLVHINLMDLNPVHFSYLIIHHTFSIFLETFCKIPTVFFLLFFSSHLANVCKVPKVIF